jgi:putative transposase
MLYNAIMPRIARIVFTDVPYHITQRGSRRQDVFFTASDRKAYLEWMRQYSNRYDLEILAYCLMTNHVHIIATPRKPDSMARTINVVHMRHAQNINKIHGWDGHLWKGRFFSTALDERHLWLCLRYIEQNPVYAGLVKKAQDYPWSSAAAHCGLQDDPLLTPGTGFDIELEEWDDVLREVIDRHVVDFIKKRTHAGLPCGDRKFLVKMGKIAGLDFLEKKSGRPSKSKA